MVCRLLILLYLTCIPLGISADNDQQQSGSHQKKSDAPIPADPADPADRDADTEDTDNPTPKDPDPPTQEPEKPGPKDYDTLFDALNNSDEPAKEIEKFLIKNASLKPEELTNAIETILKGTAQYRGSEYLLEAIKALPEEQQEKVRSALLKLNPEQILGFMGSVRVSPFSQEFQRELIEKVLPAVRENPTLLKENLRWAWGLARRAELSEFKFEKSDLENLVFKQKAFETIFIDQLFKQDPSAPKKVLDLAMSDPDPKIQRDAFKAIHRTHPDLANTALAELSQSEDSQQLLRHVRLFRSLENNQLPFESISKLLKTASPEELTELSGELRSLIRKNKDPFQGGTSQLNGLAPERLTLLGNWALGDQDFGYDLYPLVLKQLVKDSPTKGLALASFGMTKDPLLTAETLDDLNPDEARNLASLAPQMMNHLMETIVQQGKSYQDSRAEVTKESLPGTRFMGHFPEAIKPHESALRESALGKSGPVESFALSLLGVNPTPENLNFILERASQGAPRVGISAAHVLSQLPETPELKEGLVTLLSAKDDKDLTRLHLRQAFQNRKILQEVEEQILQTQIAELKRRPGDPEGAVGDSTTRAALGLMSGKNDHSLWLGEKALAARYLLAIKHPEATRLTEELFQKVAQQSANPAGPMGYQHTLNQLQGLLTEAQSTGLKIDPALIQTAQDRVDRAAEGIWNRGNPARYFRNVDSDGETTNDSNSIPYATAVYLAALSPSQTKTPAQIGMLDSLKKTLERSPEALPYDVAKNGEPLDQGALLDSAPTVGRTLTSYLALSSQPETNSPAEQQKIPGAERILSLANQYLNQFPQTHEIPRNSDRTHDRTRGGQQMAPYYGPANDVHFAQAMKLIAEDSSLPQALRDQAIGYSEQMRLRLLTYADNNGNFPARSIDSFQGETASYQVLMGLALRYLPRSTPTPPRPSRPSAPSPQNRLLRQAIR